MPKLQYFARFDGVDIEGKRYALGDAIDSDVDSIVIGTLANLGQISTSIPTAVADRVMIDAKPVEDLSRFELESAAVEAMRSRMAAASDDQLRDVVERHRESVADAGKEGSAQADEGDSMGEGSTDSYEAVKDKPLGTLKTANLVLIAEKEGVSLDGISTNPERVKAIEDARKAS